MTPKTRDKECTALRYKAGGAAADVEKKRKLFNCSEHYIRIKQIKSALAAVVAEIDPKDATTSEVFGHLTKAHGAVEAASSLLAGNSRVQRTLTDKSDFECQPTMLERANIFHHWHAAELPKPVRLTKFARNEGGSLLPVIEKRRVGDSRILPASIVPTVETCCSNMHGPKQPRPICSSFFLFCGLERESELSLQVEYHYPI